MKEQTPITAEEWYKKHTENDLIRKRYTDLDFSVMEQYAQAKVLEALEREFNHKDCININRAFFNCDGEFDILSASEYYETEVKPRIEKWK